MGRQEVCVTTTELAASRTASAQVVEVSGTLRRELNSAKLQLESLHASGTQATIKSGSLQARLESVEMDLAESRKMGACVGEVSDTLKCELENADAELAESRLSQARLAEVWSSAIRQADTAVAEIKHNRDEFIEQSEAWMVEKVELSDQIREVEARHAVAQEEHEDTMLVLRMEAESAAHEAVRFLCLMDDAAPSKPDMPTIECNTSLASTDCINTVLSGDSIGASRNRIDDEAVNTTKDCAEVPFLREELANQRDLCEELHAATSAAAAVRAVAAAKDALILELREQLAHEQLGQPLTKDKPRNSRADLPRNREGDKEWGKLVGNLRSDIGKLKQFFVEGDSDVLPAKHEIAEQNAVHFSRHPGNRVARQTIADGQNAGRLVMQPTPVQNLPPAQAHYTLTNSHKPSRVAQSSQMTLPPNIVRTPAHFPFSGRQLNVDPQMRSCSTLEPFSAVASPRNFTRELTGSLRQLPTTIPNLRPEFIAPSQQCAPPTRATVTARRAQS